MLGNIGDLFANVRRRVVFQNFGIQKCVTGEDIDSGNQPSH